MTKLPTFIEATPSNIAYLSNTNQDPPELRGNIVPEECTLGSMSEALPGVDVAVYTNVKTGRPWVGRILKTNNNENKFKIHWYRRPNRSKKWTADYTGGVPNTSDLSYGCVMFWGFTVERGDHSFGISDHYYQGCIKYWLGV